MDFTLAWELWLLALVVIEGAALLNKKRGDTLTAHVIRWFDARKSQGWNWKRLTLLGVMSWLTVHFVWEFMA
jgi:hypothetical protein